MTARGALNETTVARLIAALKAQNWTLSVSVDGDRWRAEPPDAGRKVVVFATRPADLTLVIRDLREQGLIWPPPGSAKTDQVVRSTPFAPKPHPGSHVEGQERPAPRPLALVRPGPKTEDEAFERMKEARAYLALADEELAAKQAIVDERQEALRASEVDRDRSQEVRQEAARELDAARKVFDAMFSSKEPR